VLKRFDRCTRPPSGRSPTPVNAVAPGRVATYPEYGVDQDDLSPSEAAGDIVRAATLNADGPTGRLLSNGKPVI
jgi:hypothetical protein